MKGTIWRFLCVLLIALVSPVVFGTMTLIREYHGKKVTCVHSGLVGTARSCGPRGYTRVFTGTIKSVTEVGDFDKRLEFMPDQVFVGDSSEVTAVANQGCLDNEVQAGQNWLVYLYQDSAHGTLVMPYQSASKPVAAAGDDIAMLRHLVQLKNDGAIVGHVYTPGSSSANHRIVAKNVATHAMYTTSTNANGYFEFDLPPGRYQITATTEQGIPEEEYGPMLKGEIPASKGECWEHDISLKADR